MSYEESLLEAYIESAEEQFAERDYEDGIDWVEKRLEDLELEDSEAEEDAERALLQRWKAGYEDRLAAWLSEATKQFHEEPEAA